MTTSRIITAGHRRVSISDLYRQLGRELRQLATAWRTIRATVRTTVRNTVHLPRRCTVTAIQCGRCRRWTKPACFSVCYMACPPCTRTLAASARALLRSQEAAVSIRP